MKKQLTFVVNPKSGTSKKDNVLALIPDMMDSDKFDWHVEFTRYAGHATEIAAQCAARGHQAVVAVGGDGTVNEVARALIHTDTALGIIPVGSGNGLARHLQIPVELDYALQVVNNCMVKDIDYCKVNDIPFFCTCGVGFDASVSANFASAGKRGMMTYAETMIRTGLRYKGEEYEVEIDGVAHRFNAFLITCANASQYGNNVYIAPAAHVTDGLIDVTIIDQFPLSSSAAVVYALLNRTILDREDVHSFKCRSIKIRRSAPGVFHYDGDPIMGPAELDVQMVPGGLKAIVSPYERYTGGPIRGVMNDIYETTGRGLRQTRRRILHINKDLLGKLSAESVTGRWREHNEDES